VHYNSTRSTCRRRIRRSQLQSLFLNQDVVLRTETSPSQIHVMEEGEPPVYMISTAGVPARDSRRDPPPIFHQVEGLAVDRGITMADLKGTPLHLTRAFGSEREMRSHALLPVHGASLEPDVSCFLCSGQGRGVPLVGWIELGGSGMVDPNVLDFVGYDPEE
jgi:phenylalanyl-tRNA synthetase alpha chain